MSERSNRREVRNPILALPEVQAMLDLPEPSRVAFCALLTGVVRDARERAQRSWRQNKGPMAAYWKATGAYAEHLRRVLKRSLAEPVGYRGADAD